MCNPAHNSSIFDVFIDQSPGSRRQSTTSESIQLRPVLSRSLTVVRPVPRRFLLLILKVSSVPWKHSESTKRIGPRISALQKSRGAVAFEKESAVSLSISVERFLKIERPLTNTLHTTELTYCRRMNSIAQLNLLLPPFKNSLVLCPK